MTCEAIDFESYEGLAHQAFRDGWLVGALLNRDMDRYLRWKTPDPTNSLERWTLFWNGRYFLLS